MDVQIQSPQRALVIDDDSAFRHCLCRALRNRGWETTSAENGQDGIRKAQEHAPDLIVVDLRMAGMSGLEALPKLRSSAKDACIIMLTGFGSIATAVEATKRGADHYLTKPVDADQLEAAYWRIVNDGDSVGEASSSSSIPTLDRVEWEHLQRVWLDCGGNISEAARLLKMHRKSLQRKLARPAPPVT